MATDLGSIICQNRYSYLACMHACMHRFIYAWYIDPSRGYSYVQLTDQSARHEAVDHSIRSGYMRACRHSINTCMHVHSWHVA